jgi:hypothetical protein
MHVQANLPAVAAGAAAARLPEIREIRVMGVLVAPAVNPQRTTKSRMLSKRMNLLARGSGGSLVIVPLL